jgi:hypothetical protein
MGKNCDKLTICIHCKHYLDIPYGDCVDGIQLFSICCAASVKNRVDNIDLVSGEENHYNTYHYCNEINNGHCPKYESASISIKHNVSMVLGIILTILLISSVLGFLNNTPGG